jgi:hypothetical protein
MTRRSRLRPAHPTGRDIKGLAIDLGTWSSAVTLFDNKEVGKGFDPAQEQALRSGLAQLLRDPDLQPVTSQLFKTYQDLYARIAVDNRPKPVSDIEALARQLHDRGEGTVLEDDALEERRAAQRAMERTLMDPRHARLAELMAPRMHRMYDEVFGMLPLRLQNLWVLPIHADGKGSEVSSMLALEAEIDQTKLLDEMAAAFDSRRLVVPGIKRRFARQERVDELAGRTLPDGWPPDTDLLIGQAYRDLVRRAEDDVIGHALVGELGDIKGATLQHVVVTFPTTLAPNAKDRLRGVVADALGLDEPIWVHMDYDEAVAAALFFLVRGFSGNRNIGIEAFQARATRVPRRPQPTWRRNMLVVDIGGGTTDIALLAVELADVTLDPAQAQPGPALDGRHFVLRPRVLGTTGHPQLGGDLLTLRMFYWLKAAIADAIGASPRPSANSPTDGEEGLAAQVIGSKALDPVPPEVGAALRERVPTHTDGNGYRAPGSPARLALSDFTQGFQKLWVEMENAKIAPVSQDRPRYQMDKFRPDEIEATWATALAEWAKQDSQGIELASADFERLIRPIVAAAAGLAADLVRRSIGNDPEQRLDMVALCGRTTAMPEAKAIVLDVLGRELSGASSGQRRIGWDPAAVVVEHTYSKHAASIGACWAYATSTFKGDEAKVLQAGIHELDINVDRLIPALPADLGLAGAHNQARPVPWLRAGQPFDMADQTGTRTGLLFTRTEWRRLDQVICLHRILAAPVMGKSYSMEWGTYDYRVARVRAGLSQAVGPDQSAGQVWYQIEIDQELRPRIWLCMGTARGVRPVLHPDGGLDLTSRAVVSLNNCPGMAGHFDNGRLRTVPRIEAVATAGEEAPDFTEPVLIFAAPAGEAFGYDIASDGKAATLGQPAPQTGPATEILPGAVSARSLPMPPPGAEGPVRFHLILDGAPLPDPIAPPTFRSELPVPDAPYWALLDAHGTLRIVAGYPPYLAARSLDEMEANSGHPWLAPMEDGIPPWKHTWDPFTGDH